MTVCAQCQFLLVHPKLIRRTSSKSTCSAANCTIAAGYSASIPHHCPPELSAKTLSMKSSDILFSCKTILAGWEKQQVKATMNWVTVVAGPWAAGLLRRGTGDKRVKSGKTGKEKLILYGKCKDSHKSSGWCGGNISVVRRGDHFTSDIRFLLCPHRGVLGQGPGAVIFLLRCIARQFRVCKGWSGRCAMPAQSWLLAELRESR